MLAWSLVQVQIGFNEPSGRGRMGATLAETHCACVSALRWTNILVVAAMSRFAFALRRSRRRAHKHKHGRMHADAVTHLATDRKCPALRARLLRREVAGFALIRNTYTCLSASSLINLNSIWRTPLESQMLAKPADCGLDFGLQRAEPKSGGRRLRSARSIPKEDNVNFNVLDAIAHPSGQFCA